MSSYPVATTSIYPVYCYSNPDFPFTVGCTNQLLIVILACLNLLPLSFLLLVQAKKHQAKKPVKLVTLCLMISLQIVTAVHYFFILKRGIQVV